MPLITPSFLALAALLRVAAAEATVTSTRSISAPTARPTDAWEVPPTSLVLGLNQPSSTPTTTTFSENLVDSLAARIAAPPVIRVGGTTGDTFTFDPNQEAARWCPSGDCNGSSDAIYIIGPSYFDAFKRFQSAHWTFQCPLGPDPNVTNIQAYVQRAYEAAGASRVDAIAIGNEVNWYEHSAGDYLTDAQTAKDAINSAIDLGEEPIWEILDSAVGIGNPYTVEEMFDGGINDDGLVKYVAEHYYQYDGSWPGITDQLLSQGALKEKFNNYSNAIHYTLSRSDTNKFIFSETGGPLAITTDEQYFFANTLWSANFRLYAMTWGVSRVEGTQRPITKRSLWIPESGWIDDVGPRVQAPYYALPYVADFIGKTVSGDRGVFNLDLGEELMSGYAMFEGDSLARIALINLTPYDGGDVRNAITVHFSDLGSDISNVQVRRLHADAGTAAGGFDVNGNNITYAGQQWSYEVDQGNGHGTEVFDTYSVTDGAVDIPVPDTEAVLISMT